MRVAHERAHALERGTAVGANYRSANAVSAGKNSIDGREKAYELGAGQLLYPTFFPFLTFLCTSFLSPTLVDGEDQDSFSEQDDLYFRLRPVTALDFSMAIKKLKASVDDSGKEIMKVLFYIPILVLMIIFVFV